MGTSTTAKTKKETRGLTDTKVNPPNKTAAMPLVKASVADYVKADTESTKILDAGLWGVVEKAQECRSKHYLSEKDIKQMYKEELQKQYPAEDLANKLYPINKAIRIAFGKTAEEIAVDRKQKGFNTIYQECTTRKIRNVSNTFKKDVMNQGRDDGEKEETKGYNRFEEEEKEEEEKQRSSGGLVSVVTRLISEDRITPQMMVRAVSIFIAEDLDATKEVICSLLEENEWALDVAREYCKQNPV